MAEAVSGGGAPLQTDRSWISRLVTNPRSEPPPHIEGYEIELVKGRRHARKLDRKSWVVILAVILSLLLKIVLIIINGSLVVQDYNDSGAKATNIALLIVFCQSVITHLLGLYAVRVRSTYLTFVFLIWIVVTVLLELLLEALDLSLNFAVQSQTGSTVTLQQMIFMIFLGQLLQMVMAALTYRFWMTLRNSSDEETIVRVRRLQTVGTDGVPMLEPARSTASAADVVRASKKPKKRVVISSTPDPSKPLIGAAAVSSDSSDDDNDRDDNDDDASRRSARPKSTSRTDDDPCELSGASAQSLELPSQSNSSMFDS